VIDLRVPDLKPIARFRAKQKLEIVVASLRDRSIVELCREHEIAESLLREWLRAGVEGGAGAIRVGGRSARC